jgi:hypothetical protein
MFLAINEIKHSKLRYTLDYYSLPLLKEWNLHSIYLLLFDYLAPAHKPTPLKKMISGGLFMFLAINEIKHSKLRYTLVMGVMFLIAYLVFFLTGLAYGLAQDNRTAVDKWPITNV